MQAASKKPIRPISGPGPARLRPYKAYRLGPVQAPENFRKPGQALPRPGLPGPLGTLEIANSANTVGVYCS